MRGRSDGKSAKEAFGNPVCGSLREPLAMALDGDEELALWSTSVWPQMFNSLSSSRKGER